MKRILAYELRICDGQWTDEYRLSFEKQVIEEDKRTDAVVQAYT